MPDSWRVTLPCTRAEAETIAADPWALADLDPPPALMTSEEEGGAWRLDAYFETKPTKATVARLTALVPGAREARPQAERVPDADWLTLSQAGLEPVRAGRFFVHAGEERAPPGATAFRIPAGLAFGTGQHETTSGCLALLDRLKRGGAVHRHVLDLGTGTGLLAFAAMRLWPGARATASDIDPVSIAVTRENARANGIRLGTGPGALALAAAPGFDHRLLLSRAPYDLITANILAAPLIDLSAQVSAALAPGGALILAGLLRHQASAVARAYRRQGLRLAARTDRGDWPTLLMVKRNQPSQSSKTMIPSSR